MNILFFATDAYGGHGGIAYYNRCLAEALAEMPSVKKITLLPRLQLQAAANVPAKVNIVEHAAVSMRHYVSTLVAQLFTPCKFVICGHINLLHIGVL